MLSLDYLMLLAALQGFTEFLPVSSSAHLALLPSFLNAEDQGMFIDIAAHVGSLLAVIWHYRARVLEILSFKNWSLTAKLAVSFAPVLALGLLIDPPRGVAIIAINSIVFGILLYAADRFGKSDKEVSLWTAFIAGLAQVVALIPGVSRSGITITAMRARGVSRKDALDFTFLMSMPAIAAAGGYELIKAIQSPEVMDWSAAGWTVLFSAIFSLIAIRFMLKFVQKFTFAWFSAYRIALGIILLAFFI
ncbi:MAG: undecaprenyl-diphosphate phosphatase [Rickettsiales bacterium]|jgi:undecaprenyl-diphosphatase|nr:undecaprenyl-diphosphate phosphatase [Rickettsiales bacterium]